jgi:hypothetical protein
VSTSSVDASPNMPSALMSALRSLRSAAILTRCERDRGVGEETAEASARCPRSQLEGAVQPSPRSGGHCCSSSSPVPRELARAARAWSVRLLHSWRGPRGSRALRAERRFTRSSASSASAMERTWKAAAANRGERRPVRSRPNGRSFQAREANGRQRRSRGTASHAGGPWFDPRCAHLEPCGFALTLWTPCGSSASKPAPSPRPPTP